MGLYYNVIIPVRRVDGEKHTRRAPRDSRCKEQRDATANQTAPRVNRHHQKLSSDKEDVSEEA